jgi:hypothetical protein
MGLPIERVHVRQRSSIGRPEPLGFFSYETKSEGFWVKEHDQFSPAIRVSSPALSKCATASGGVRHRLPFSGYYTSWVVLTNLKL